MSETVEALARDVSLGAIDDTVRNALSKMAHVHFAPTQLAAKRLELDGLELTRLQSEQELLQQLEDQRSELRDLELELREKQASLEESVQVVATEDGRVLELLTDSGSVISSGSYISQYFFGTAKGRWGRK